jgi:adenylate cyclase
VRVARTFAFLDLSGFTDYTAAYGDDAAARILGEFRTLAREVASARGVRIAKWLGDGCMVVGVDQESVLEFVTELEHRASRACAPLILRAGLATGQALLFEGDDYIGSAVNPAARLCDYARDVGMLMPTSQLRHLPEGLVAEPIGEIALRGFPGAIDVVRISGVPGPVERSASDELWIRDPVL